jgi:hypothetical protein
MAKYSGKTGTGKVFKDTLLKPKPQTAKQRHKSPSQITNHTNNHKKISLGISVSASTKNFISNIPINVQ